MAIHSRQNPWLVVNEMIKARRRLKLKLHRGLVLMALIVCFCIPCYGEINDWPTNGWATSTPEQQGMNSEKLSSMVRLINQQKADIDSILIVRHGKLVLESYRYPNTPKTKHVINSCTKSVISAILGIAMKEGYIKNIDQKLGDYFPKSQYKMDEDMAKLQLKYLLTMSSGMDWMEVPLSLSTQEMTRTADWVRYILESPMDTTPGSRFNYNSGGSHLLSAIITQSTGRTSLDYGKEKLFIPLGIQDLEWECDPQKIPIGGWGLKMLPADMAKIGFLYLQNGVWGENQIVPKEWVVESTQNHIGTKGSLGANGYGYQWWMTEYGGYYALGYAGQYIFVVPEKDLVVVFTSSLKVNMQMPEMLMRDYILPSISLTASLPSNEIEAAKLAKEVSIMSSPK